MGPGGVFGETAVLTSQPRTASVEAIDDVSVGIVTTEAIENDMGQTLWLSPFMKALADRFREVDGQATAARGEAERARIAQAALNYVIFRGQAAGATAKATPWAALREALHKQLQVDAREIETALAKLEGATIDVYRDMFVVERLT